MKNLPRIALAALLALPIASFAQSSVQVGFSPKGSARKLVLDTIASAKTSIQVLTECQVACRPAHQVDGEQSVQGWRASGRLQPCPAA